MVMNDNISEQKSLFQAARISLSAFLNNVQIELDRRIDDYENNRMWNACSFDLKKQVEQFNFSHRQL